VGGNVVLRICMRQVTLATCGLVWDRDARALSFAGKLLQPTLQQQVILVQEHKTSATIYIGSRGFEYIY
jgi:hypothetical protein